VDRPGEKRCKKPKSCGSEYEGPVHDRSVSFNSKTLRGERQFPKNHVKTEWRFGSRGYSWGNPCGKRKQENVKGNSY